MFINCGNLRHKSSLDMNFVHMNHMREKAKKKKGITRMISAEMKLYLKEKIFCKEKQPSICRVLLWSL